MRTAMKTAFRPHLESIEVRIVATAGLAAAVAHHVAATQVAPKPAVHPESKPAFRAESKPAVQVTAKPASHAAAKVVVHPAKHPAKHPAVPVVKAPAKPKTPAPVTVTPKTTVSSEAWIELVNMTGQDLEYQVKLGPYANGRFLTFDIGAGQAQYRMSSLLVNGQREKADFAIQFGNGPVTPLMTGISQQSAKGYYIFFDSNFQPYVTPFIRS